MTDLYKLLGVRRAAGQAAIRAAYRKKSKAVHPDSPNGSAEAFVALKLAHDVLTDPAARAHYDATGEVTQRPIDQGRAKILTLVASALDIAVNAALQNGEDLSRIDLVSVIQKAAKEHLAVIARQAQAPAKGKVAFEKIIGRFTAKTGGENVLAQLAAARLTSIERDLQRLEEGRLDWEAALALIESHAFKHDPQVQAFFFNTSTATTA